MQASTPLVRSDWESAALRAIAADGIDKLSVERLATSIGVTKGSFYWHFVDRAALIAAAAEQWERLDTDEVIAAMIKIDDPCSRLRALLEVSFGDDDRGPTDAAMATKADDAVIGSIVRRVTAKRIGFLTSIFSEIGLTPARAAQRARLTYGAYLGHFQIARALGNDDILATNQADYLDQAVHTLAEIRAAD